MHKYPHYSASGGGGAKKAKRSGGGGGGGGGGGSPPKQGKKRTSFVTAVAVGGIGLEVAAGLGYAQARAVEDQAMELAGKIGIASGAGLLAAAIALKAANTKKAASIPILGGAIAAVGSTWANILADVNMRP